MSFLYLTENFPNDPGIICFLNLKFKIVNYNKRNVVSESHMMGLLLLREKTREGE